MLKVPCTTSELAYHLLVHHCTYCFLYTCTVYFLGESQVLDQIQQIMLSPFLPTVRRYITRQGCIMTIMYIWNISCIMHVWNIAHASCIKCEPLVNSKALHDLVCTVTGFGHQYGVTLINSDTYTLADSTSDFAISQGKETGKDKKHLQVYNECQLNYIGI